MIESSHIISASSKRPLIQAGQEVMNTASKWFTAVGEQGDGIAKIEQGYVVIVPDATPGEQPTVEIEHVRPNVAFVAVKEPESRI